MANDEHRKCTKFLHKTQCTKCTKHNRHSWAAAVPTCTAKPAKNVFVLNLTEALPVGNKNLPVDFLDDCASSADQTFPSSYETMWEWNMRRVLR